MDNIVIRQNFVWRIMNFSVPNGENRALNFRLPIRTAVIKSDIVQW